MFSNDHLMLCFAGIKGPSIRRPTNHFFNFSESVKTDLISQAPAVAALALAKNWNTFTTGTSVNNGITFEHFTPFSQDHVVGYVGEGATYDTKVVDMMKIPGLNQVKKVSSQRMTRGMVFTTSLTEYYAATTKRAYFEDLKAKRVAGASLHLAALSGKIAELEAQLSDAPLAAYWTEDGVAFHKTTQAGILAYLGTPVVTPDWVIYGMIDTIAPKIDLTQLKAELLLKISQAGGSASDLPSDAEIRADLRSSLFSEFQLQFGYSVDYSRITAGRLPVADLELLSEDAILAVASPPLIIDIIGTTVEQITINGLVDIVRDSALRLGEHHDVSTLAISALPRSITAFLATYANVQDRPFLRSIEAFYHHRAGFEPLAVEGQDLADFLRSPQCLEMRKVHPGLLSYVTFTSALEADVKWTDDGVEKVAKVRYSDPLNDGVSFRPQEDNNDAAHAIRLTHAVMDYIFSWICYPDETDTRVSVETLRQLGVEGVNRAVGFALP